jgi:hypothetical protein
LLAVKIFFDRLPNEDDENAPAGLPDFSWSQHTKTEKSIPNDHKLYQTAIYYTKCSQMISNSRKIYQHFLLQGPPKYTQIWIFGLKINHLATL